jgi:hypothetical protein
MFHSQTTFHLMYLEQKVKNLATSCYSNLAQTDQLQCSTIQCPRWNENNFHSRNRCRALWNTRTRPNRTPIYKSKGDSFESSLCRYSRVSEGVFLSVLFQRLLPQHSTPNQSRLCTKPDRFNSCRPAWLK